SKILATIIDSKQAGHFHGKAKARLALTSILTSDFCEYPIDAKIVEAGRNKVEDGVIVGRGHAKRDAIALFFPPTTVYQLLRIPSRGPKLIVDNETPLTIKLLQPVSLGEASILRAERDTTNIKVSAVPVVPAREQEAARVVAGPCSSMDRTAPMRPVVQKTTVVRPVRNLTPYYVSLYLDRKAIVTLPPCYGPSMVTTPTGEF